MMTYESNHTEQNHTEYTLDFFSINSPKYEDK